MKVSYLFTLVAGLLLNNINSALAVNPPYAKVASIGTAGRDGAFMFAVGPDFYLGGGESKDLWVYHSDSGTLRQVADILNTDTSRVFSVAFAIGNKGYVGLGFDGVKKEVEKNDLLQFNPSTNTWARMADFPGAPRNSAFVFVIGNTAYIGGGSDYVNTYSDFYAYNSLTNTWTKKKDLPETGLVSATAFTINNAGYITCGAIMGVTETNTLYKYDTTSDTWTQLSDFPGAARQTAVAMVIDNKAYVGLGMAQYTPPAFSDFYSYDPASDHWAKITAFTGSGRAWPSAASNGTKGYLGTGWDLNNTWFNDLWSFDASQAAGFETAKLSLTGVNLYPNPANDYLYASTSGDLNIKSLTINDISGRTLKTVYPDAAIDHLKIDISGLARGVYFLNISSGQAVECKKFVVN